MIRIRVSDLSCHAEVIRGMRQASSQLYKRRESELLVVQLSSEFKSRIVSVFARSSYHCILPTVDV
jgi:hypothetical protein